MRARQAQEPPDARAQVVGSGLGYVDFAAAEPALFQLMFGSRWSRNLTPELAEASEAAFHVLTDGIAALRGVSPFEDAGAMAEVVGCWSTVHGFATLMLAGQAGADARDAGARPRGDAAPGDRPGARVRVRPWLRAGGGR